MLDPQDRSAMALSVCCAQSGHCISNIRKHRILAGDRVTLKMSPYDLTKGRMSFRHKDERAAQKRAIPHERPISDTPDGRSLR